MEAGSQSSRVRPPPKRASQPNLWKIGPTQMWSRPKGTWARLATLSHISQIRGHLVLPLVSADLPLVPADLPLVPADLPLVSADLPLVSADLPVVSADLP